MNSSDWLGLTFGLLSIAINIFFYFFELKGQINKVLLSQQHELSSFRSEYRTYSESIVRSSEGTISKEQALKVIELYYGSVSSQLSIALERYVANEFLQAFATKNSTSIMVDVEIIYDKVVRKSLLPLISPFCMRGGLKIDELVVQIGADSVKRSFEDISSKLSDMLEKNEAGDSFITLIKKRQLDVIFSNKQECIKRISEIYGKGSRIYAYDIT